MGHLWMPHLHWKTMDANRNAGGGGPRTPPISLDHKAIAHFKGEVEEKVSIGQAILVAWDSIKDIPPPELKILPIAAIPHKSKQIIQFLTCLSTYGYNRGYYAISICNYCENCPQGCY
jgi:hypothetical protein